MKAVNTLCTAASIAGDGSTTTYYVPGAGISLSAYDRAILLVDANCGADSSIAFTAEVSPDNANWYASYVHNLHAAADEDVLAASVTLTADTVAALLEVGLPLPYLRFKVSNANGKDAVVLTAQVVLL